MVRGKPRLLFWIEERPRSLDLTVKICSAQYLRVRRPEQESTVEEPLEHHFSIHRSSQSTARINVITGRTLLRSGRPLESDNYAQAMKQHSYYAHIFAVRCPSLFLDRFIFAGSEDKISLGDFDESQFQLVYQVLVSTNESPILLGNSRINCLRIPFSAFRITVLWSFLSFPASSLGAMFMLQTTKPEELALISDEKLGNLLKIIPIGFPPAVVLDQFGNLSDALKTYYITRILESVADKKDHIHC